VNYCLVTLQSVAGIALAVGAVVGVLKYTKRDKDVEGHAKSLKHGMERKGKQRPIQLHTGAWCGMVLSLPQVSQLPQSASQVKLVMCVQVMRLRTTGSDPFLPIFPFSQVVFFLDNTCHH
jgi:hypothetical protein